MDDFEVTLKRNPKTDGLRTAMQEADMRHRGQEIVTNLQVHRKLYSTRCATCGMCFAADHLGSTV